MNMQRQNDYLRALLVLICGYLAACVTTPAPDSSNDFDTVDSVIDGFVQRGEFPYVFVRIEDKAGELVYQHVAVNRELLPDVQIDEQSWTRIWSMSKIVTIATVLDLVEDGRIALDADVLDYLPELRQVSVATRADGASLTGPSKTPACPIALSEWQTPLRVIDLINHTAGFYYAFTGIPCMDDRLASANLAQAADSEDFLARLVRLPLIQQPGERYYYGLNTTVLGLVAERATGQTLKSLVRARITEPLDIDDGLDYGLPAGATLIPPHIRDPAGLRQARPGELSIFGQHLPTHTPAGKLFLGGEGMVATAEGYLDFLRMLLSRGLLDGVRILDQASIEAMVAPHTQIDDPKGHNGYNIWVSNGLQNDGSFGVSGLWQGGGYESTHYWVDPERELVGVVFSQMSLPYQQSVARDAAIRRAFYQALGVLP